MDQVRHILEAARTEINRQRPDIADELLKSIRADLDTLQDPLCSAEHQLILAEIIAARRDSSAEPFFEEAIRMLDGLGSAPVGSRLRAAEHYGDFLTSLRQASVGRRYYEKAREIAVKFRLDEDSARLQLKLLHIDLELDRGSQLESFRVLKRVADRLSRTASQQLSVWIQYIGFMEAQAKGLRFARNMNVASEAYFENLFKSLD